MCSVWLLWERYREGSNHTIQNHIPRAIGRPEDPGGKGVLWWKKREHFEIFVSTPFLSEKLVGGSIRDFPFIRSAGSRGQERNSSEKPPLLPDGNTTRVKKKNLFKKKGREANSMKTIAALGFGARASRRREATLHPVASFSFIGTQPWGAKRGTGTQPTAGRLVLTACSVPVKWSLYGGEKHLKTLWRVGKILPAGGGNFPLRPEGSDRKLITVPRARPPHVNSLSHKDNRPTRLQKPVDST